MTWQVAGHLITNGWLHRKWDCVRVKFWMKHLVTCNVSNLQTINADFNDWKITKIMPLLKFRVDSYNGQLWICCIGLLRTVLWDFTKTHTDESVFSLGTGSSDL